MTAQRCTATSSRTGERCKRWPLRGASVCTSHGAGSPKVRRAAADRLAEQEARAVVGRLLHDPDAPAITDPYLAGMKLAGVVTNAATVLGARVNLLESLDDTDDKGQERMRTTVVMWRELLTLALKATGELARLDLEERHLRLEAARTAAVLAALEAGVAAAALTEAQEFVLRSTVGARLRELEVAA